jgi:hypothetical protein
MQTLAEIVVFYSSLAIVVLLYGVIFFGSKVPQVRRYSPLMGTVGFLICGAGLMFTGLDRGWIGAFIFQLTLQTAILERVPSA